MLMPGVPVFLHAGAVLDNWDPRVVDGIAAKHQWSLSPTAVSALEGRRQDTVTTMADTIAFVRRGSIRFDLLGFSLGASSRAKIAAGTARSQIILTWVRTGGGVGIGKVTSDPIREHQGHTDFQGPQGVAGSSREPTAASAARQFVKRLKERKKDNRGKSITVRALQLKAIRMGHAKSLRT